MSINCQPCMVDVEGDSLVFFSKPRWCELKMNISGILSIVREPQFQMSSQSSLAPNRRPPNRSLQGCTVAASPSSPEAQGTSRSQRPARGGGRSPLEALPVWSGF
ncbi:uncharacterized protein BKA55DRAFT_664216 [Fusarium redolens]|uniref:Uncharacterized protein n=1 Tax=Fusarium redolens TaxID=48865 RepID=A0A9P9K964_FUSRE|nr:uncharacterized protein BKA55DRAFT_664216 [Fusarium redolens]KAH7248685.1 hypothetical protein BKA55DRAFT_664216 [Fusarium redolens]